MPEILIPDDKRDLYQQLIDSHPEIELKGGKKLLYTSHNGHMFTQMNKAGKLGLRLAKEDREAFMETYQSDLFRTYGTVMKEYVDVPDDLLANTAELKTYLLQSYSYVKTLKPKKT